MPDPIIDSLWFRLLTGIMLGMVLGSFVTMLAYRLPRKLSIVAPPSTCPSCKTRLGIADLVPIFSWLTSGGKCRHCAAPIGARYVLIELAVTGVIAAILALGGFSMASLLSIILLLTAVFYCLKTPWLHKTIESKK